MGTKPWDLHPPLKPRRLHILARIIKGVRDEILADLKPVSGKVKWQPWVRGSAVHGALAFTFEALVESKRYPWLSILDPSMQFIVGVEGVPIRIYNGEAEKPSRSAVKISSTERASLERASKGDNDGGDNLELFSEEEVRSTKPSNVPEELWAWRIAVETDLEGSAYRTTLVQVSPDGDYRYPYNIHLHAAPTPVSTVASAFPEGVELSAPLVGELPPPAQETGSGGTQGDLEDGPFSPNDNDDDDR